VTIRISAADNLYILEFPSFFMGYSFVYLTCGSEEEACSISRKLLEEKLIACANIFPVLSIYRWKESLEEAEEYAAFLKTEKSKVPSIIEEVKRLHSYEVPDIVEIPLGKGFQPFFQWISEVVE
jgi:periplasmic divalent cation tolerance protein